MIAAEREPAAAGAPPGRPVLLGPVLRAAFLFCHLKLCFCVRRCGSCRGCRGCRGRGCRSRLCRLADLGHRLVIIVTERPGVERRCPTFLLLSCFPVLHGLGRDPPLLTRASHRRWQASGAPPAIRQRPLPPVSPIPRTALPCGSGQRRCGAPCTCSWVARHRLCCWALAQ